jgi:hypothetical protein
MENGSHRALGGKRLSPLAPPLPDAVGRSQSFAKHSPTMLLAHFIGCAHPR